MATYTGKALVLTFAGTALEADYRSFEPNFSMGLEDASAGSDAGVTRLTTLKDGSASLTMRGVAGGTATLALLTEGAGGTLTWQPEGTAVGKPKGSVYAIVESLSESLGYNSVTEWSVTFQQNDATGLVRT